MKKYLSHTFILVLIISLAGCSNWLDVVPENDIETIETEFEKREKAEQWLKTCYSFMIKYAAESSGTPAYLGADEFCGHNFARKNMQGMADALFIGDGTQMTLEPYCNVWHQQRYFAAIRYCNIFLENIFNVYDMKTEEKKIWAAEVKAVKAFYYFDLMRRYGPIVLIDKNMPAYSSSEEMQRLARRPIDECVDAIVTLCDEAMRDLPYMKEKTSDHQLYFNKEATATLKALTLLYAASPLFNGNPYLQNFKNKNGENLFPAENKEKWKIAAIACDSAIRICDAAGKKLVAGYNALSSPLLNTMRDIERTWIGDKYNCSEAILILNNEYDPLTKMTILRTTSAYDELYDPDSRGCLGAPMKMVNMFYTDHGLPIEEDRQWLVSPYAFSQETDPKYKDVVSLNENILNLHRRREPRFYAMIAADRTLWYRKTSKYGYEMYDAIPVTVRQGEAMGSPLKRFDEDTPQNATGYWIKKGLYSELPLQQYHYKMQYSGGMRTLRYMFRLAELYLAAAEAWNECEGPSEKVYDYLDKVRERAGISKVREAWKNYAKHPEKVSSQSGLREIIRQEWNIEFMFEGRRYWNLRRWMTAQDELCTPQTGWNVLASTEKGFYNDYQGPMIVWGQRTFESPKDYFIPIRSEEILISGVVQNPGW
ncbi:RagB/SusD family nutrient uptake outer membrane protein [Butyricimonas sp.]|uniref:RagB/SusD family nutrient uptake outer membrane protein n=1 Tax=Butyricimonas sp. TaxID=1969738 RepID=UPI0025B9AA6A|nr:RagB/SusD family nutrient uptake outer membrane protein [Butyricimonas sp.]